MSTEPEDTKPQPRPLDPQESEQRLRRIERLLGIGSPVVRPLDEIAMERLHAHATTPPGSGPHLAQAVQEIQEEARKVPKKRPGYGPFPPTGGAADYGPPPITPPHAAPAPGSDAEHPPEEYLPCPFCGLAPESQPWHGGGPHKTLTACENEDCHARPSVTGESPEEARIQWNTRATVAPPQESAAPALVEEIDAEEWKAIQSFVRDLQKCRRDEVMSAQAAHLVACLEMLVLAEKEHAPVSPFVEPAPAAQERKESDRERADRLETKVEALRKTCMDLLYDHNHDVQGWKEAERQRDEAIAARDRYHDERNAAMTGVEDLSNKLASAERQRDEALERVRGLEGAIRWALGEGDSDFPGDEYQGRGQYGWRTKLRRLAALSATAEGGA